MQAESIAIEIGRALHMGPCWPVVKFISLSYLHLFTRQREMYRINILLLLRNLRVDEFDSGSGCWAGKRVAFMGT